MMQGSSNQGCFPFNLRQFFWIKANVLIFLKSTCGFNHLIRVVVRFWERGGKKSEGFFYSATVNIKFTVAGYLYGRNG
jgi:hypothetical protein